MTGVIKPNIVDSYLVLGVRNYSLNINISFNGSEYEWEQVEISVGKWNYSGVVDALVQYKYPIDKMQAVINNYLLDPNDAYAIDEFNKMQAWRKEAKEIAKEALTYGVS